MVNELLKDFIPQEELAGGRDVPFMSLIKATGLVMLSPFLVLVIMVVYEKVSLIDAISAMMFITVFAIMVIRPYIANLSALTSYVRALGQGEDISPPNLSFFEELSGAVSQLHEKWEHNRIKLEDMVDEWKILVNTLPDCLVILDKKMKIVRVNKTTRKTFGGKNYKELLKKILKKKELQTLMLEVLKTGKGVSTIYYLEKPLDTHFIVSIEYFPKSSHSDIALVLMLHDISEQKETERMLADFVANASHEIRTPLTSVLGFIETLQTTAKGDKEAQEKFLEIMHTQATRMSQLINGLLSLSQIERSIGTSPTDKVSVPAALREVQSYMSAMADEKDITINLAINGKLPKIIGDYGELIQVFENIVSNAIKYSNSSSAVSIAADLVDNVYGDDIPLRNHDKLLAISVSDMGVGIENKHLKRLTERFYRVDSARSRKVGGTGLGLSIVRYILERHHGVLKMQSIVGQGSVFTVLLPVENKKVK